MDPSKVISIEGVTKHVGEDCVICNQPEDNEMLKLPCGHIFGKDCIVEWFEQTQVRDDRSCPVCRRRYGPQLPRLPRLYGAQAELWMTMSDAHDWAQDIEDGHRHYSEAVVNVLKAMSNGITQDVDQRFTLSYDVSIWPLLAMGQLIRQENPWSAWQHLQWTFIISTIADLLEYDWYGIQGTATELHEAMGDAIFMKLDEFMQRFKSIRYPKVEDWDFFINDRNEYAERLSTLIVYVIKSSAVVEKQPPVHTEADELLKVMSSAATEDVASAVSEDSILSHPIRATEELL